MMCQSCGDIITDATETDCPKCGQQLQPAEYARRVINRTLARPRISAELDFATTIDRTGSSLAFQKGIPLAYEKIVRGIEQQVRDVKLYLFSHGDLDCNEETILLTDGGTVDQAVSDVKRIIFSGGGDVEETHQDAIEHVMNHVPWRNRPNKSRSALLAFLTDDSKPCRSGLTPRQLGEELKKRNILLYLICQPTPTLSELVTAAGGLMFAISNSPDPKELEQIANQLTASIHAATSASPTLPLVSCPRDILNMIVFLFRVSVYAALLQYAQSQRLRRNWLILKAASESDSNVKYLRDRTLGASNTGTA